MTLVPEVFKRLVFEEIMPRDLVFTKTVPKTLCLDMILFCFTGVEGCYWLDKPDGKMQQVSFEVFVLPFIGLL